MSRFDTIGNLPSSDRNAKSRVALALVAATARGAAGRRDGEITSFSTQFGVARQGGHPHFSLGFAEFLPYL
jgi:hypothetical protein